MDIPAEILLEAENVKETSVIPKNSEVLYWKTYQNYISWKESKGTTSDLEPVLLSYFKHIEKLYAPSTLWVKYSHLNATIFIKSGIIISNFEILKKFIKRTNEGYAPKKATVLAQHEIIEFVKTAPRNFLLNKIILIFAFIGEKN